MSALAGTGVPVARTFALCEDETVIGTAFYVMEYVEGRILWDPTLPGMTPAERARALRRAEPRARGAASRRLRRRRPRRLRQARPLHRAAGRALDEAVRRRRDRAHPGDGRADRLAAAASARRRRDVDRPRRLPPRQRDLSSDRAARPRRARLGTVDARASAVRFRVSGDGVAPFAAEFRGLKGFDLRRARHSVGGRVTWPPIAGAPAAPAFRIGSST